MQYYLYNILIFKINIILYFKGNDKINSSLMGIGDWGLGIGDWGLGPIPNPQSPIPNPQSPIPRMNYLNI